MEALMVEEETYTVRLVFNISATSHEAAVKRAVHQLARYGIIDWVYQVQRDSDDVIDHFNGDIDHISLEQLKDALSGGALDGNDPEDDEGGEYEE